MKLFDRWLNRRLHLDRREEQAARSKGFVHGGATPPIEPMDLTDEERAVFEVSMREMQECKCCTAAAVVEAGLRGQIAEALAENARLRRLLIDGGVS